MANEALQIVNEGLSNYLMQISGLQLIGLLMDYELKHPLTAKALDTTKARIQAKQVNKIPPCYINALMQLFFSDLIANTLNEQKK